MNGNRWKNQKASGFSFLTFFLKWTTLKIQLGVLKASGELTSPTHAPSLLCARGVCLRAASFFLSVVLWHLSGTIAAINFPCCGHWLSVKLFQLFTLNSKNRKGSGHLKREQINATICLLFLCTVQFENQLFTGEERRHTTYTQKDTFIHIICCKTTSTQKLCCLSVNWQCVFF